MDHARTILRQRIRRRFRVRRHIRGTAERPRLTVFRTHKHIYAQVIDDSTGRTLASASTMDKAFRGNAGFGGNQAAAAAIGKAVAEQGQGGGYRPGVFRSRRVPLHHGHVAALARRCPGKRAWDC